MIAAAHMNPPPLSLSPGERLLLHGVRAWLVARAVDEPSCRLVADAVGKRTTARVAAYFCAWMQAAEAAASRPLEAECDGCGGVSSDVQRLVAACGLAPVDTELGARLVESFLPHADDVMVLGRCLNQALVAAGWAIPARIGASCAQAEHRRLH